jgi:hypothetical protein
MSLTATVLAFASGLAAKIRLSEDKKETTCRVVKALEKRIRSLECQLCDAEAARIHAEVMLETLAFENARRRRWEERQAYAANRMNAQMAQAQQAQAMAQVNPQWQAQQNFQQLGAVAQNLLGAQNLQLPADWCTCIPDRASALRGPR